MRRDFGPSARGEEPAEDFLVLLAGRPVGLIQRNRHADYPDERAELARSVEVPDGALGVDYFIGDPALVGRGLGPRTIAAQVERIWTDFPSATCVIVPVAAANRASWRALEKAGLDYVGDADLEPDNPVDDRRHVVHRIDRPVTRAGDPTTGGAARSADPQIADTVPQHPRTTRR